MAQVQIRINCGCGARFTEIKDAQIHAEVTGHKLTILGEVK